MLVRKSWVMSLFVKGCMRNSWWIETAVNMSRLSGRCSAACEDERAWTDRQNEAVMNRDWSAYDLTSSPACHRAESMVPWFYSACPWKSGGTDQTPPRQTWSVSRGGSSPDICSPPEHLPPQKTAIADSCPSHGLTGLKLYDWMLALWIRLWAEM